MDIEDTSHGNHMRRCGASLESFETIHVAGEGPRCHPCFNRETADRLAIGFDEPQFQPIVLRDVDGTRATLLTGDPEIKPLEGEQDLEVQWLLRRS